MIYRTDIPGKSRTVIDGERAQRLFSDLKGRGFEHESRIIEVARAGRVRHLAEPHQLWNRFTMRTGGSWFSLFFEDASGEKVSPKADMEPKERGVAQWMMAAGAGRHDKRLSLLIEMLPGKSHHGSYEADILMLDDFRALEASAGRLIGALESLSGKECFITAADALEIRNMLRKAQQEYARQCEGNTLKTALVSEGAGMLSAWESRVASAIARLNEDAYLRGAMDIVADKEN
ncbi:hypothetical protein L0Y65_06390 [Candidatus Micrarchaeota archaeon]|nr:hypothetical protein [Candidatus Micrarchaeota archaeon]